MAGVAILAQNVDGLCGEIVGRPQCDRKKWKKSYGPHSFNYSFRPNPRYNKPVWWLLLLALSAYAQPKIDRVFPLGGQRGAETDLEITGANLINVRTVEFDTGDITWKRTIDANPGKVTGTVGIAPTAALGPHMMRIVGPDGLSNSMLFNVGRFPAVREKEPNDSVAKAQAITTVPAEVYGELATREESDFYAINVQANQRLVFDLRAIEYGSQLESKLHLLDSAERRIATMDDRSDYDDGPCIEHRFATAGRYYIHVDQFRGPRAADPKNNTYILRVSDLPNIHHLSRMGGQRGSTVRTTISGSGLLQVDKVRLTKARLAEYFRLTYPKTMPVDVRPDEAYTIEGRVIDKSPDHAEIEFSIPSDARVGIYRLWAGTDGPAFEVDDGTAIDAVLRQPRARNRHEIQAKAGIPLHVYTHAAQLGGPSLDSVLHLEDPSGKVVASNDDIVSGAAALGNPDSSLFYMPPADGAYTAVVRDRLNRGGTAYAYRLHVKHERPAFQLWTLPESLTVERGGKASIRVQMARDEGFDKEEVAVWVEGVASARAKFRADQAWELGGDGLQMTTPEVQLEIAVPADLPAGRYPIRIFGEPNRSGAGNGRVAAHAVLARGPLTNLFNFTRRPLASLDLEVIEPPPARLKAELTAPSTVAVTVEGAVVAAVEWFDLPANSAPRLTRTEGNRLVYEFSGKGTSRATPAANIAGRWSVGNTVEVK